mgnify:CR=1 FL=1
MSLGAFKTFLFEIPGINNNNPIFRARVVYSTNGTEVVDNALVYMSVQGDNRGDINITEAEKLKGGEYYLSFLESRQKYSFNGSGLDITGKSQSGKPYKVTIVPLI